MTGAGGAEVWADAMLAAALVAVDPVGLGGASVRCGPGPLRDRWTALLRAVLPEHTPLRRIPLHVEDSRLLGGLDLSASIAAGRPVIERGALAACDGGIAVLSMAERIEDAVGARLAAVLDTGEVTIEREGLAARTPARIGIVALDEGIAPDERPPEALLDRLAFRLDLDGVSDRDGAEQPISATMIAEARERLAGMPASRDEIIKALCGAAEAMGVDSIRAPLLALRAARAHAALHGRSLIGQDDAVVAARLVLAPRAQIGPAEAAPDEPEPPQAEDRAEPPEPEDRPGEDEGIPAELLIEAIRAALPEGLLDQVALDAGRPARAVRGRGSGAAAKSAKRGRPVGSRLGALRAGDRLNLPETLRAAAPWQRLRAELASSARLQIRPDDFRIRRFVQRREATTIFAVDASGSSALQRLGEAKGAVELLLAKAYVSRTRVAVIGFRNTGAEVLLAPTRSLTRAKRALADLPGGGGTPLASGIEAALDLAQAEKAHERTPMLVILTDGRANIGRTGAPGRAAAEADALAAARAVRAAGVAAVFIDTAARPAPDGDRFARAMGGVYAPLPYADANAVSGLVQGLRAARA